MSAPAPRRVRHHRPPAHGRLRVEGSDLEHASSGLKGTRRPRRLAPRLSSPHDRDRHRRPDRASRPAALAGGDAAPPDRGGAQPLHRRAGGGQEGGRHRGAEPLAPGPGARRHPGRDHPVQHHHDRAHRRRKNRGRPAAGPPERGAVHQGRGVQVHRGGLRRPRRRVHGARPGGRRHQHGPDRARGRGLSPGRAEGR